MVCAIPLCVFIFSNSVLRSVTCGFHHLWGSTPSLYDFHIHFYIDINQEGCRKDLTCDGCSDSPSHPSLAYLCPGCEKLPYWEKRWWWRRCWCWFSLHADPDNLWLFYTVLYSTSGMLQIQDIEGKHSSHRHKCSIINIHKATWVTDLNFIMDFINSEV